jgi:hypothetical protein
MTTSSLLSSPELPCSYAHEGQGAEVNYEPEITTYRCPNGMEWPGDVWPYLEMECLNRRWSPPDLPRCVRA